MNVLSRWAARLRAVGRVRLAAAAAAVVAVAAALIVAGGSGSGSGSPAALGEAKNFSLQVLGHPSERISLSSLSGRPVIVNFFASWCPPCKRETPLIARFYRARRGRVAVIGIDSNDSARNALAFVRREGAGYPVAFDPYPARTAVAYGVPGLPATFFLDARHRIVMRLFGSLTAQQLAAGARLMTG